MGKLSQQNGSNQKQKSNNQKPKNHSYKTIKYPSPPPLIPTMPGPTQCIKLQAYHKIFYNTGQNTNIQPKK